MGRILVGVDGSEAAKAALEWAMEHADDDDTVVACNVWSMPAIVGFEAPTFDLAQLEQGAKRLCEELVASVDVDDDGPTIETEIAYGHPGSILIEKSREADLVVVGSRGYGGFRGLLLGSVSTYVVHHAVCPVVVIPTPADRGSD